MIQMNRAINGPKIVTNPSIGMWFARTRGILATSSAFHLMCGKQIRIQNGLLLCSFKRTISPAILKAPEQSRIGVFVGLGNEAMNQPVVSSRSVLV